MSSQQSLADTSRDVLIQRATVAIYNNSTTSVFFHTAVAEQVGLGATEEKTLLMLSDGPRTAGEIAQHTGLTTGSVTSLIDRMEKKGFVRRIRDTQDRRRVIVEADPDALTRLATIFATLQPDFADLFDGYSDEELRVIVEFIERSSQKALAAIARLSGE